MGPTQAPPLIFLDFPLNFYFFLTHITMKPIYGIPAVAALVYRAWARKSLTPFGLVVAALSATVHVLHPWNTPFVLLAVFYFAGTKVTKVKHDIKARLTLSATGAEGGEGARNHIQVLANSLVATLLIIAHAVVLYRSPGDRCFSLGDNAADVLMVGIVGNYVAVAADTFSSELGILSKSQPRLITSLSLRKVPPGTNGGVTATGLGAGLLGAFCVALSSAIFLPFCADIGIKERALWTVGMSFWGLLGSVLDSVLGGLLQASVVDKRSGKVVEGSGGRKVLVHPGSTDSGVTWDHKNVGESTSLQAKAVANTATPRTSTAQAISKESLAGTAEGHESRKIETGNDWLDNNGVNFLMAFLMSAGAMIVAQQAWGTDAHDLWTQIV
ncbi:hypothetical protein N7468_001389 [Penicillium chermesinum]|uniref:Uncharacterized protein n=1 Tax=Penicillium chermesinum TaxID=63820 RepID=A0A9W9PGH8_9EURO|nr:uncharacterized protein N7468_001389 [Penicillium chermesinum]KAJ5246406.1 hypothetical protein N7468_001389 [Penicillium chermesinum]